MIRVLCVDDDVHVRSFVAEALGAEGFEVHTALDGNHALQKIAPGEPTFDVIIADGRMPHLDGWRFIMQARANGYEGKVIVFSGYLDEYERARYRELRIDGLIDKPPASGELLRAMKEITADL